ncbi:hypothetical protein [Thauera aminoaromatica]|jgi:hypothetical protein|uniref:Restriction endonuclease subunit S n=1 Tax=Thauera aminoaromatica TaxID=164330 RepID=A0A5C7T0T2_THASP|nr:hypothetical protein [Thauera aminoaromatica]TXH89674.1 MAG: restriction endonuclease subunit S [Thauera aminoaromatica]
MKSLKWKVVRSAWLEEGGRRLDCNPYMSGALEARDTLERLACRKDKLSQVTLGMFDSGRESRKWVDDPSYGVRYMGSSAISLADLSSLPLISTKQVEGNPKLLLEEGWSLITRSGTIGRMAYVRPDMAGLACSEDVLRVVPNPERIPPGYLYAFLSSTYGVPLVVAGTYGAIIQHIEPEHIANLPVPRFGPEIEAGIHATMDEAAKLLSCYQRLIREATHELFRSVGLRDISATEWHSQDINIGFEVDAPDVTSLRALNFNPRFLALKKSIESRPHRRLDEICIPGSLGRGVRFKRIDAEPSFAYQMIGQKELFWLKPEGRWIAKSAMDSEALGIAGATMVAAQGTLGESELFCRAEFVWGPWTQMAFSEHILRVVADESVMARGCLFAFMRSETAFRMLRSISTGSKLQDHHYKMRGALPVPYPDHEIQLAIHNMVVTAYEARHRAVALIEEATQLLEHRIAGIQS